MPRKRKAGNNPRGYASEKSKKAIPPKKNRDKPKYATLTKKSVKGTQTRAPVSQHYRSSHGRIK
jgi:hypothetical protein